MPPTENTRVPRGRKASGNFASTRDADLVAAATAT